MGPNDNTEPIEGVLYIIGEPITGALAYTEEAHDEKDSAIRTLAGVMDAVTISVTMATDAINRLLCALGPLAAFTTWAKRNHPRLLHLSLYAKTNRKRKKNAARLLREYREEAKL